MLLAEALARVPDDRREAESRRLVEEIAAGFWRVRYFNFGDIQPETSPAGPPRPRPPHREEPLPEHFFRLGTVNLAFSAVSFGKRTIHGIELLIPDGAGEAAIDREQGRPSSKDLIEAEGERLLASGASYRSLAAFAGDVRQRVLQIDREAPGTALSTVGHRLRGMWRRRPKIV